MIGFLNGIVALRDDPYIFINVNGVGYKVLTSGSVLSRAVIGNNLTVYTYTYVREDALELFGFAQPEDLKLFEMLISVSGIGPKTAISVFSIGTKSQIAEAIINGDVNFFTGVPRLGKKNAQKIIIELKNKFASGGQDLDLRESQSSSEVFEALRTIGYSPQEIQDALKHIPSDGKVEAQIKSALQYLGK